MNLKSLLFPTFWTDRKPEWLFSMKPKFVLRRLLVGGPIAILGFIIMANPSFFSNIMSIIETKETFHAEAELYVKVTEPFANIYEYLNPKSSIIQHAKKGEYYKLVYEGTSWYQVACKGKTGWLEKTSGVVSKNKKQQTQPTPENTNTVKGRFGRGYKNIKWGMSPQSVRTTLNYQISGDSTGQTIEYFEEGKKSLICSFNETGLYKVVFKPMGVNADLAGAITSELNSKYGEGTSLNDMVDGSIGFPLIYKVWDDEITKITYSMINPWSASYRSAGFSEQEAFQSLVVIYESNDYENQKNLIQQEEENNRRKIAAEKVSGDL